ncbi:hypothetical protein [Hymenobacter cavernae]|uniref:DUF4115 domain-containing protein n=1 Tax=Hymenobacter cavernae TaxID=2044852 RepID=A0ABQ1U3Q2_9BACT|nr:hypothetical protein [Hymenobacter cavernae]GGF07810.1 hypothetical protein GCM10011383_18650 [Hymenobacter cavernae]
MQPEDIDKLFRDKLQHHAPTPPDYLWTQLEEELQPAKKRPVMWLYAAAAVIALLLVVGAGWLLRVPNLGNSTPELATVTTQKQTEKNSLNQPTTQATAPLEAASKKSEASSERLAATASTAQEPAPAVHTGRPLAPAPGLRRAVARTTPSARPHTPTSVSTSSAPAQAVAVATPAVAHPERPAVVPATLPSPEPTSTPALVAAAAPSGPIIVEVRRESATPGATAYAADGESGRRKGLGNLLLKASKKVGNVVLDGRQINLPKVALPEVITAQVEAYTTAPHP